MWREGFLFLGKARSPWPHCAASLTTYSFPPWKPENAGLLNHKPVSVNQKTGWKSLSTPPGYTQSVWSPNRGSAHSDSCWRWLSRLCSWLSQLCCWVGGADTVGALTWFFSSLLVVRAHQWVWYDVPSVARSVAFVLRWRSWLTNVAVLLVGWLQGGASISGLPCRIGWSHSRSIHLRSHSDWFPALPSPASLTPHQRPWGILPGWITCTGILVPNSSSRDADLK